MAELIRPSAKGGLHVDLSKEPDRQFVRVVTCIGERLAERYPRAGDAFQAFDFLGVSSFRGYKRE